jgi:hypothetical protein
VCRCSWCVFFSFRLLGLGRLLLNNSAFLAWRACIHSEEREFESRDYKIPRKAHAWWNRVGSVALLIVIVRHFAVWLLRRIHTYLLYSLLL